MIKQIVRQYTTKGVRASLRQFQSEAKISLEHRKGVLKARQYHGQNHLKLHIGCGPNHKEGWVNIDLSPQADLTLDMREPMPFLDNSCSIIYSEHFLEHIDYPEPANSFLRECCRVLEPGGLFMVGVPNTEWPLAEYAKQGSAQYFDIMKEECHPKWCQTEMEHINYHFRQGNEHRFAYDYETLKFALSKAGFENIHRRDVDPALDSQERQHRPQGTLYVNASKPQ